MAMTLLKTCTKVGIGAVAVYATVDQGVWRTSTEGSKALEKVRTKVLPAANEYVEKLPSIKDVDEAVVRSWNSGVQTTFKGVSKAPEVLSQYSHTAVESVKQNLMK